MILILKLLALLATGVFAILGMWAEHHDTKKLIKSFPFWGVILTTLLSGLLLFIETNKAAQDAIDASVRLAKTAEQQESMLKNLTGGDSFCYIDLIVDTNVARVMLHRQGKEPLYNVTFRMWDINKSLSEDEVKQGYDTWTKGDYFKEVGDIPPNTTIRLDVVHLPNPDKNDFGVEINARNGWVQEVIKLRRINGVWKQAYKVTRQRDEKTITLLKLIDPALKVEAW